MVGLIAYQLKSLGHVVENLLWLSWSMTSCPVGALGLSKL